MQGECRSATTTPDVANVHEQQTSGDPKVRIRHPSIIRTRPARPASYRGGTATAFDASSSSIRRGHRHHRDRKRAPQLPQQPRHRRQPRRALSETAGVTLPALFELGTFSGTVVLVRPRSTDFGPRYVLPAVVRTARDAF